MNRVYVVGIGPGAGKQMTEEAREVLNACDTIIGYTVYVDLVKEQFPEKEFLTTPMKQEVKRCKMAFEEAMKGKKVAMICSGDAGVYGMAGLMYEVGVEFPKAELEIVPGITAAIGGAAVLGAPLIHDFAVISLSDLLTPWEKIEKRARKESAGNAPRSSPQGLSWHQAFRSDRREASPLRFLLPLQTARKRRQGPLSVRSTSRLRPHPVLPS